MHKDEQAWIESLNKERMLQNGWHHPNANDLIPSQELPIDLDSPIPFYVVKEL